jgi:hypothetical protein
LRSGWYTGGEEEKMEMAMKKWGQKKGAVNEYEKEEMKKAKKNRWKPK